MEFEGCQENRQNTNNITGVSTEAKTDKAMLSLFFLLCYHVIKNMKIEKLVERQRFENKNKTWKLSFCRGHYPLMNYGQLADGPTCRRIKLSRDVGKLVLNPIQLIRS